MPNILAVALAFPWGGLPHDPSVEVAPKVHLLRWFTSGFE